MFDKILDFVKSPFSRTSPEDEKVFKIALDEKESDVLSDWIKKHPAPGIEVGLPFTDKTMLIPTGGIEERIADYFPYLFKTKADKIIDTKNLLIEKGVYPEKAQQVAIQRSIEKKTRVGDPSEEIKSQLTEEQSSALTKHEKWEAALTGLDVISIIPMGWLGGANKVGTKVGVKGVKVAKKGLQGGLMKFPAAKSFQKTVMKMLAPVKKVVGAFDIEFPYKAMKKPKTGFAVKNIFSRIWKERGLKFQSNN